MPNLYTQIAWFESNPWIPMSRNSFTLESIACVHTCFCIMHNEMVVVASAMPAPTSTTTTTTVASAAEEAAITVLTDWCQRNVNEQLPYPINQTSINIWRSYFQYNSPTILIEIETQIKCKPNIVRAVCHFTHGTDGLRRLWAHSPGEHHQPTNCDFANVIIVCDYTAAFIVCRDSM